MNYKAKVFNMLGLKPNQPFKIIHISERKETVQMSGVYRLSAKDLTLQELTEGKWENCVVYNISHILIGKIVIRKIIEPVALSLSEKATLTFLKLEGFNYIAVTRDGKSVAFKKKPIRFNDSWGSLDEEDLDTMFLGISTSISFLSWEDEPYYIDDKVLNEEFFKETLDK